MLHCMTHKGRRKLMMLKRYKIAKVTIMDQLLWSPANVKTFESVDKIHRTSLK